MVIGNLNEERFFPKLPITSYQLPDKGIAMTVMDQATSLRAMARRSEKRAQTIAITSGKGGVGKTNLAVNLATVLAAMRRRVVLLDADLGLANADILCNVQPRFNLAHVVAGQRETR